MDKRGIIIAILYAALAISVTVNVYCFFGLGICSEAARLNQAGSTHFQSPNPTISKSSRLDI